jgi:hypothetical protein
MVLCKTEGQSGRPDPCELRDGENNSPWSSKGNISRKSVELIA